MKLIRYWNGKPVEELSRDELLAVIEDLAGSLEAAREAHAATNRILRATVQRRASTQVEA